MSEEPIHDRCAGLDDGPDLMPVDQFGDVGAAVADELCDFLEGTPASESSETKECRNSRGVQSAGLSPGTRARARRRSRRMLAASMPVPSRVVNTSPVSVHRSSTTDSMSRSAKSLRIAAVALAEPLIVEVLVMADLARWKDLSIWAGEGSQGKPRHGHRR